jgi:hypothetical protein
LNFILFLNETIYLFHLIHNKCNNNSDLSILIFALLLRQPNPPRSAQSRKRTAHAKCTAHAQPTGVSNKQRIANVKGVTGPFFRRAIFTSRNYLPEIELVAIIPSDIVLLRSSFS